MQNKIIYIIGCGGHARSVADVVLDNNPSQTIVFVDENARENETIFGFPVVKDLPENAENIFIAIGDNAKRQKLSENKNLINIISKRAYISPTAEISDGIFIGDGVHIGPFAKIGRGCIINNNAVIEHECEIGKFAHVSVNTTICGRVHIGNNVFMGAGTTVRDYMNICSDVTVGVGAAIVKNITEPGIYVGVPANKIK